MGLKIEYEHQRYAVATENTSSEKWEEAKVNDTTGGRGSNIHRSMMAELKDVDGGWAWMVVVACFSCQIMIGASSGTQGILINTLHEDLQISYFLLSWIGSISYGSIGIFSYVVSLLIRYCGYRKCVFIGTVLTAAGNIISFFVSDVYTLYFTMGLMQGIGLCFLNMCSLLIVFDYFHLKRVFALTIINTGAAIGFFISPYVVDWLSTELGWRLTCLYYGGFYLNGFWCSLILKKQNTKTIAILLQKDTIDDLKRKAKMKKKEESNLLKNVTFYTISLSLILACVSAPAMDIYISLLYAQRVGEGSGGTFLISLLGLSSFVGRILFGAVVNKWPVTPTLMHAIGVVVTGICYQFLTLSNAFSTMMVLTAIIGILNGAYAPFKSLVMAQNFGMEQLHLTCALAYTFSGIANLGGAPLAAMVMVFMGSTESAYLVTGALFMLSGIILVPTIFKLMCPNEDKETPLSTISHYVEVDVKLPNPRQDKEKPVIPKINEWTVDFVMFV